MSSYDAKRAFSAFFMIQNLAYVMYRKLKKIKYPDVLFLFRIRA
jgi:hypothetical protein